jgi:hypothetical protein
VLDGVLHISLKLETYLYARAVRHVLKMVFVAAMLMGSAVAQTKPLIGSSASFLKSSYCKTFACRYAGKIPITKSLDEYRYVVLYRPDDVTNYLNISVFRQGDTVVSVGFSVNGADTPFEEDNIKPVLALFEFAGAPLMPAEFLKLQAACDSSVLIVNAFKLTCARSDDAFDAARWNYRIFTAR